MSELRRFRDVTVAASDLVVEYEDGFWIENTRLDACTITGPAVLMISGPFTMSQCDLDPRMFMPIEDTRAYLGVIALRRVNFVGCSFKHVGIAGTRELIQKFFEA